MALYFFHFSDGDLHELDDTGLECSSAEHALLEAAAAARGMWAELLAARRDPRRCAFEVTDSHGEGLFRFDFSELYDECREPVGQAVHPSEVIVRALHDTQRRASTAKASLRISLDDVRSSLAEVNELMAQLALYERRLRKPRA